MTRYILSLLVALSSALPLAAQTKIVIETGREVKGELTLSGRDSGQQLLVTGQNSDGGVIDLTRKVKFTTTPAGIVAIDNTGYMTSQKEGRAVVHVKGPNNTSAKLAVVVTNLVNDLPINFANEVTPIFTRFSCNSGGCHGKSGGQNGFALSLLGFVPQEDYEHLVNEGRGRRVTPVAPDVSLLLQKSAGRMAHGGGTKFTEDSAAYRVLRRWIMQGMPYGRDNDPIVTRVEVVPSERIVSRQGEQQLSVVAHFSDGSTKDVTRLAQFEPNDKDMAEVSEFGLMTAKKLTGTVAVMARFQSHVGVFRAMIPLGAEVASLPKSDSFIDKFVFENLKNVGLPPSAVCDDTTFLRRATVDIAGRLPTLEETKEYLADSAKNKREKLVDRLLASGDYADYFTNKWSAVLRNKRDNAKDDPKPTFAFHKWIRDSLHNNKPYDQFVREIMTATGKEIENPPVTWYREVKGPEAQMEDVSQLFLGMRIQCAKCHHHPFEKWSQQDYYGFTAFFTQLKYKEPPRPKRGKKNKKKKKNARPLEEIYHQAGIAKSVHPRTGESVIPTGLGGQPMDIPKDIDPRGKLADWMTSPENPYFARTLVNRYWKHFFGRGLVDPEDDMRVTNPATNPKLLAALEKHFIQNKFDLKNLVRTICLSKTYQLSAVSNEYNKTDKQNFSRFYPRRLNAEVLLDAIDQVTRTKTKFAGAPQGTRAVQLPDNAFNSYFLSVFGRPNSSSACECERSSDTSLGQMLHLLNSADILTKVGGNQAQTLAKDKRPHQDRIRELYLTALSREPNAKELDLLSSYAAENGRNPRQAYEDMIWAIINSQEFLYNH